MKVVILVHKLSSLMSHRITLARTLLKNGYEVVIGFGEFGNTKANILKKEGFRVCFIPIERGGINLIQDIKSLFLIWNFFKKENPKIVHLVTIKPYLYGGIIARLIGVPAVISAVAGLGSLFISQNLKSKFLKFCLHPFFRFSFGHQNQQIIVQNKDDLNSLIQLYKINPKKFNLIKGSGVDLKKYNVSKKPLSTPTVCFAGRLLIEKGVMEYISAANLILKKGITANFWLAGDIDDKNPSGLKIKEVKKLCNEAGVKFLGYCEDLPSLYAKSNIICLPSYREGFPKSLMEAAAAGRAIVTTDVPGCRDTILKNKSGLLVTPKDTRDLAKKLQLLIQNPERCISMGYEGRKLAEKKFDVQFIVEQHLKIYKKLIYKIK